MRLVSLLSLLVVPFILTVTNTLYRWLPKAQSLLAGVAVWPGVGEGVALCVGTGVAVLCVGTGVVVGVVVAARVGDGVTEGMAIGARLNPRTIGR